MSNKYNDHILGYVSDLKFNSKCVIKKMTKEEVTLHFSSIKEISGIYIPAFLFTHSYT